jgi:hypothetical protein
MSATTHTAKRSLTWGPVWAYPEGFTIQSYYGSGYSIVQHCTEGPWQIIFTLDAAPVIHPSLYPHATYPTVDEARKATEELAN